MKASSLFVLIFLTCTAFANPIPPGWQQPKQEFAIPTPSDLASALPLFAAAIAIELLVSAIFLWHCKKDYGILKYALAANAVSIPLVWAYCFAVAPFFIAWQGSIGMENFWLVVMVILSAEAFAVGFEAYLVFHFNKKKISLGQALWMALFANVASFLLSPAQASSSLSLFPLLAALLLFPFIAAYLALPRLGLKKLGVWRTYAGYIIALFVVLAVGGFGPLPALVAGALACFASILLLNPKIGAKKAALLAIVVFLGLAAGIVAMLALAYIFSAFSH